LKDASKFILVGGRQAGQTAVDLNIDKETAGAAADLQPDKLLWPMKASLCCMTLQR